MTTHNQIANKLIKKIENLSPEKIKQVEQFIDSLNEDNLTDIYSKFSEPVLNKIWDNPEDADYDNL
ncbi:toxin-antitoxin system, antitoxin component, Xre family protein [Crocosphaera sp. UHCC 0190]|uniref:toxin-antitoxin system, antitoxin component, Xre family protein n=1 Tax=Crocosphaera sp. UHCC 0190 TaxID=3110246 RepID=UPI002B206BAF|nr:toxin-antitoxin system, antitoxin component, Xre family protein [Crocosphaera sp. UHCC 0190]MEA5508478.1 toxin-antitoxin system, antitoxin component, Xre family protein [Crocosphaera sp. UHCC 0190]